LVVLYSKHKAYDHFKSSPDCKIAVKNKCVDFLLYESSVINELRLDRVINNNNEMSSDKMTKMYRKHGYL
jgi:hypothetical protein